MRTGRVHEGAVHGRYRIRHHHHRLRAGRLCDGHPRRPARLQDGHRRARTSGRHLPQLGLHPDQGAAALRRNLSTICSMPRIMAFRRRMWASMRGSGASARAPFRAGSTWASAGFSRRTRCRSSGARRRSASRARSSSQTRPRRRCSRSIRRRAARWRPAPIKAKHIIIATGARPRVLPGLEPDGKLVWTYFEAMVPPEMPKSLLVVGSGAIGIEFASFYQFDGCRCDRGRDRRPDHAGGRRRDRQDRPEATREARPQDQDRRQGQRAEESRPTP